MGAKAALDADEYLEAMPEAESVAVEQTAGDDD
jgi:hypothetical protein